MFGLDSFFLFIGVLCLWMLLSLLAKSHLVIGKGKLWLGVMVISIAGAAIPIILINEGVISNKPGNIIIAGFSAFYMAILAGRLDKPATKKKIQ